jgi:predicted nucleotidyltransferase
MLAMAPLAVVQLEKGIKEVTAMETQVDRELVRQTWRRREAEKAKEQKKRREAALAKAHLIATRLKEEYGVQQVYLYGSLAWGRFGEHSDIDLLVYGFPRSADYWTALAAMEHLAAPYPVQIVLAENASFALRRRVGKEGILL